MTSPRLAKIIAIADKKGCKEIQCRKCKGRYTTWVSYNGQPCFNCHKGLVPSKWLKIKEEAQRIQRIIDHSVTQLKETHSEGLKDRLAKTLRESIKNMIIKLENKVYK